jgi:hypothetical protein
MKPHGSDHGAESSIRIDILTSLRNQFVSRDSATTCAQQDCKGDTERTEIFTLNNGTYLSLIPYNTLLLISISQNLDSVNLEFISLFKSKLSKQLTIKALAEIRRSGYFSPHAPPQGLACEPVRNCEKNKMPYCPLKKIIHRIPSS